MSRINGFIGRRHLFNLAGMGSLGIVASMAGCSVSGNAKNAIASQAALADAVVTKRKPVSPDEALKLLLQGNQRFVQQKRKYPDQSLERIRLVAQAQYPFAAILGCADSRVPAEIVFDRGLGDLFVVRIAGNVASESAIGSLEYATNVLGSQVIVVLGHKRCGAVATALQDQPISGRMGLIVENIKPAVEKIKSTTDNLQVDAVVANIKYQAQRLQDNSTILAKLIRQNKLKIVSALYDLDTGAVSIIKT
ncbi:carbonic anhydrase [Chlorogloeopsis fritschii PCC 9212]|uniref:carbonic anhydrase n=1 Tax=Chlorogloeopsis fritschii PCC 6912 TaxID=211165 RepID=A0A3S0ZV70_CHLFR|nr:carbonic anhydrase [Chlorogloeopsis fritschii]MBF2008592.1 carbonic anhydrase [Chlorogloeopsis fritschii C42_A2020_084]RUR78343.1 carbonic anhydrase [Chlorogloeopsis fritschii PCC 6912]